MPGCWEVKPLLIQGRYLAWSEADQVDPGHDGHVHPGMAKGLVSPGSIFGEAEPGVDDQGIHRRGLVRFRGGDGSSARAGRGGGTNMKVDRRAARRRAGGSVFPSSHVGSFHAGSAGPRASSAGRPVVRLRARPNSWAGRGRRPCSSGLGGCEARRIHPPRRVGRDPGRRHGHDPGVGGVSGAPRPRAGGRGHP